MPRRVQDIIPANHRSMREISPRTRVDAKESSKSKKEIVEEIMVKEEEEVPIKIIKEKKGPTSLAESELRRVNKTEDFEEEVSVGKSKSPFGRMPITPPPVEKKPRRKIKIGKWPIITVGVIVLIAIIGYFASSFYSQATFTIVPKVVPVTVNSTYVAQGTPESNGLSYQIITKKITATTTVTAVNGPMTNTKASGKVTFYNSYSSQAVRLVAGTRLSSESGLIYKLASSIVIPAYTKPADVVVPGKITSTVTADQSGQNYNISQTDLSKDLKIVAYKGSPKYDTIYAKPVTSIAGGFSGVKKIINPSALASSTATLKSQITTSLLADVNTSIPDGYIMYEKGYTISFGAPVTGGNDPSTATVSLQGTIYGIAFPKNKLVESIAGNQTISLFGPFAYTAPGLESLEVVITNLKDFSPTKKGALVIHAKGGMKIIGTIPVDDIKKKLAGISLASTQEVFKSYSPVIESGSGELAPPWAKIPTDLSRIKVIVQEP
ncbi:MAG: hypothetical protein WCS89_01555 [Candidatus Paceibacterota bacterium]